MDRLFQIKEQYTYEDYLDLNKYYMTKSKRMLTTHVILAFLLLIILSIGIYLNNIFYLIFSISFTIVYPVLVIVSVKSASKKAYNSNKIMKNMNQEIIFFDEYFEVKTEVQDSKVYYDKLYSIQETKKSFLLFIAFNQAFIVKKADLDNVDKFRKFICLKK